MAERTSQRVVITDGNATLITVDSPVLLDPKDMPKLTARHLVGAETTAPTEDLKIDLNIGDLMPLRLRIIVVGAFMYKFLLPNPVLLHEVYLLGERGFIELMKKTERVDSLAKGLTARDLGEAWRVFEYNVQLLAARGAKMRRRRDTTI